MQRKYTPSGLKQASASSENGYLTGHDFATVRFAAEIAAVVVEWGDQGAAGPEH